MKQFENVQAVKTKSAHKSNICHLLCIERFALHAQSTCKKMHRQQPTHQELMQFLLIVNKAFFFVFFVFFSLPFVLQRVKLKKMENSKSNDTSPYITLKIEEEPYDTFNGNTNSKNKSKSEPAGIVLAFRIVYFFLSAAALIVCIVFLGIFYTLYEEHRHTIYYQLGIAATVFGILGSILAIRNAMDKKTMPGDWYMFMLLFYLAVDTVGIGMLLSKVPGAFYPMIFVAIMTVVCVLITFLRCCPCTRKVSSSILNEQNKVASSFISDQPIVVLEKKEFYEIENRTFSDPQKEQ